MSHSLVNRISVFLGSAESVIWDFKLSFVTPFISTTVQVHIKSNEEKNNLSSIYQYKKQMI